MQVEAKRVDSKAHNPGGLSLGFVGLIHCIVLIHLAPTIVVRLIGIILVVIC
ncbi:MAG: hypothetical protein AB7N91_18745 [Candidatus Tectimicrobiota bacterium]